MSTAALKRHLGAADPISVAAMARVAIRVAWQNREDCHAYRTDPHCVVYTAGPDLDHPKREADMIAHYIKEAK